MGSIYLHHAEYMYLISFNISSLAVIEYRMNSCCYSDKLVSQAMLLAYVN